MKRIFLLILAASMCRLFLSAGIDEAWVRSHYTKSEHMVTMRDGVGLYTIVYQPVDTLRHPILMFRSTYGSGPYGEEFHKNLWGDMSDYVERGYIIVHQDVRGRRMSEGEWENVRPVHILSETGTNDVTDMYDTAEWLVNNTCSNGNIGVAGNSYLGFTALTAALSGHPAVKAVCPQAPVGDWFMGDDFHHNGVFMPAHAFGFLSGFGLPRPQPTPRGGKKHVYYTDDEYSFYLRNRSLPKLTEMLGDSVDFWANMISHPDYDKFWSDRNPLNHMGVVKPAVLVVGGWFDAEDLYGALSTFKRISVESPSTESYFLMGPWSHGGWGGDGRALGSLRFGSATADWFRAMQLQFFEYYLRGEGEAPKDRVMAFSTGDNQWHRFAAWPPVGTALTPLYLDSDGLAGLMAPVGSGLSTTFTSDPDKPVPHTATVARSTGGGYMYEDQRFASRRPDVLTFVTEPLDSAVTVAGPVRADIWMSSSTDDADVVVKLIDVYPDDFQYPDSVTPSRYPMGGYQQLVRGDIMAARYRDGFMSQKALVADQPSLVGMDMPDVFHTFQPGHRIMVQIQGSWFPLFRMSPQQLVDPYTCSDSDFIPADITIYHNIKHPSRLFLPVLK